MEGDGDCQCGRDVDEMLTASGRRTCPRWNDGLLCADRWSVAEKAVRDGAWSLNLNHCDRNQSIYHCVLRKGGDYCLTGLLRHTETFRDGCQSQSNRWETSPLGVAGCADDLFIWERVEGWCPLRRQKALTFVPKAAPASHGPAPGAVGQLALPRSIGKVWHTSQGLLISKQMHIGSH